MNSMFDLDLREYYELADWTPTTGNYLKTNGIDDRLTLAHAGNVALLPCHFDGSGYFDFAAEGETSLICEALDEDAARTIDLVAFSVSNPARFGTARGAAPVLGMTNVSNPASWAFGKLLAVHRRPLDWLRAGCRGVVILDHRAAPAFLSRKLGDLLAEDEAHARDLRMMLCQPTVDPASIKFPRAGVRRVAA